MKRKRIIESFTPNEREMVGNGGESFEKLVLIKEVLEMASFLTIEGYGKVKFTNHSGSEYLVR